MKIFLILTIIFLSFTELFILFLAARSGKFFKALILNAVLGLLTLTTINLISRFTGFGIAVNFYTVIGSALFSLPSVIFFLLLPFIFI
jgi:hypothetical protein